MEGAYDFFAEIRFEVFEFYLLNHEAAVGFGGVDVVTIGRVFERVFLLLGRG